MGQQPADADRREEQVVGRIRCSQVGIQLHGKLCHRFLQHGFCCATVLILAGLPRCGEAAASVRSLCRSNWKKVYHRVKSFDA